MSESLWRFGGDNKGKIGMIAVKGEDASLRYKSDRKIRTGIGSSARGGVGFSG